MLNVDRSTIALSKGNHRTRNDGVCFMEAEAWLAGLPHSDFPSCSCRVVAVFAQQLNDRMPSDAMRTQIMGPLLGKTIGTATVDRSVMIKRACVAADFAAREAAPAAFDATRRGDIAAELRALDPILDLESAKQAGMVLRKYAAYAAANADANDAAYAAYVAANAAANANANAAANANANAAANAAKAAAYTVNAAYAAAYAANAAYAASNDAAYAANTAYAAAAQIYRDAANCMLRMCEVNG